jgi:hypothetical protein
LSFWFKFALMFISIRNIVFIYFDELFMLCNREYTPNVDSRT